MPTADKSLTDLQFKGPLPNDRRMLNAAIAGLGLAYVPEDPAQPHASGRRASRILWRRDLFRLPTFNTRVRKN